MERALNRMRKHPFLVRIWRSQLDLGPAMKLIGALDFLDHSDINLTGRENGLDDIIVVADDDKLYSKNWLPPLIHMSSRFPDAAIGYRGYVMTTDEAIMCVTPRHSVCRANALMGYSGVVYKRSFFSFAFLVNFYSTFPPHIRECMFGADDEFFGAAMSHLNIPALVISNAGERKFSTIPRVKEHSRVYQGDKASRVQMQKKIWRYLSSAGLLTLIEPLILNISVSA
ncbi:hypothetical protein DUNSADRAFT_2488 [Dunaliella salina]|uniref:Glycosyl transferase 64 domain-containing protein n=1 Tax=Dunaliella salina TaxID=3046 RepID=A0ABQ7FW95_DUNSA|nr:hypothetical protein DUNSADRAFT_2488 [Dunaliella salina]|eukprot:KAF5826637.1 hypothetical protein DUNSADRAFT_2488 [Dunaliella salina]